MRFVSEDSDDEEFLKDIDRRHNSFMREIDSLISAESQEETDLIIKQLSSDLAHQQRATAEAEETVQALTAELVRLKSEIFLLRGKLRMERKNSSLLFCVTKI
jgi:hypothetical protein